MRTLRKLLLHDDHHTKSLVATHLHNTVDVEALQKSLQTLDMNTALETLTKEIPLRPVESVRQALKSTLHK
jgi:hypothetical protein